MSAVTQKQRTKEVTSSQSGILMKNLIRTAVSTIAWMRNLFDAENFKEKVINDDEKITIHALVPHHNQQAKLLIQWLEKGVFDALNKKFVETITFAIYGYVNNADKATLMETYSFVVDYDDEGHGSMRLNYESAHKSSDLAKANIKKSTVRLLRTLVTLSGTFDNLPDKRYFTINLTYRDDVTPENYEPHYFEERKDKSQLLFQSKPRQYEVGKVITPYHMMKLRVQGLPDECDDCGGCGVCDICKDKDSGRVYDAEDVLFDEFMTDDADETEFVRRDVSQRIDEVEKLREQFSTTGLQAKTIAAAQSPAQSSYVVIDENHLPDSQVEHAMLIQTQLEREERPFVCNSSNVDLLRHKFPDLSRKYIKKILNLLTERQSAGATQQQEQQPEQPQSQPRDSAGDGTADTGLAAFKKYVFDTQTLTMKKLSKELGLSKTVIRGYMQVLEQQGVLEKIGRTTRYTFSQEPAMTEQQTEEKAIPAQLPPSAMDTSDSSSASAPPVTNAHHGNASTSAAAAPAVVPSSSLASLRSPTRGRARGNQKSSHRMDEVDMTPPIAKRSHKAKGVSRSRHSRKRKQEELELEMEEAEAEANNNNVQAIGLAGTETGAAHGNGTIVLNGAEVSIGPAATSASTLTGQDLHENEHGMSTFSLSQDQYQVMHPDDDGSPSSTRAEVPYTIDEEEEMETQTQTQTDNDATDGKGKSNRNMGGNDRRYHGQHDDFSLSQSQPLSQSQSQPESQSQNEDFPMSPPLLNSESRQQQRHSRKKRRKTSTIKSPIYQTPW